jgi:hypothetical protein
MTQAQEAALAQIEKVGGTVRYGWSGWLGGVTGLKIGVVRQLAELGALTVSREEVMRRTRRSYALPTTISTYTIAKKPARQLDAEIATSLADRARAKGFEPETEEGGRAMMQSLTLADVAKLENRPAYLAPGTPVEVHFHQVGGTTKLAGTVKWDYRKDVDVKLASYGGRVVRASRSSSGLLNIYHL